VTQDGSVWGRPVGVAVAKDGALLFSEDGNGSIWRVRLFGSARGTMSLKSSGRRSL
jgi:glucose/arabinose dehydrogenase